MRPITTLAAVSALLAPAGAAAGQDGPMDLQALKRMTILELSQVQVTSVSRRTESLGGAAAAVAVITHEDLQRSGARTIPDALRAVPGIYVGQRNANSWAVASRGFSSINSEKLLVLSDTRSVYTPLFSGVFWDMQNFIHEDIERIEVIRGPGATQWGSNAVNGVINITTRHARDTQGWFAEAGTGSEEQASVAVRHGARLGERGHYRVFGQYFERDASHLEDASSPDDWHVARVGFRADWEAGSRDHLTLQGAWQDGKVGLVGPAVTIIGLPGPPPPLRVQVNGGNLLARWSRDLGPDAELQLRAYYDHSYRNDPSYIDQLDVADVDFQHQFRSGAQQLTWGINYRRSNNANRGRGAFALARERSVDEVYGGFIQDQIALGDHLELTLGTKLEHNDFSGFEIQPSLRAAWQLPRGHTLWAAVSRAVRVPTRVERDMAIELAPPGTDPTAIWFGNPDFDAERLLAWELGYRRQISASVDVDLAAFLNRYRGLASVESGDAYIDPRDGRTVTPIFTRNLSKGRSAGGEALLRFSPTPSWRLVASYAFLDAQVDPQGLDLNDGEAAERSTPRHQFGLRSALNIGDVQLDASLRRVGAIGRNMQAGSDDVIGAYTELDLRAAWVRRQFEFAVTLQNLLHRRHVEFGSVTHRGSIERSIRASIAWRSATGE